MDKRVKYKINKYFFDKWSNEMAYVLGFIITDGNIAENPSPRFRIAIKDRETLIKIRKVLKSNHPIKFRYQNLKNKKLSLWYLDIGNRYMYNKLLKLGVVQNKSLIVDFPKVPKKYLNHFIRGIFDGDGSVYSHFCKANRSKKQFSHLETSIFSGSIKFIEKLSKILKRKFRIKYQKYYEIILVSQKARKFLNYIYKNKGQLFMKRKYNYYLNYKNTWRYYRKPQLVL